MVTVKIHEITKSVLDSIKLKAEKCCSAKSVKKRFPIAYWLPQYNWSTFLQDSIAGVTVGLTAIAQCLAFAVVAGLPAEYGLYSGLMSGLVYVILGGCKVASVGPTAILSALVARYISGYNEDFAVLSALLTGLVSLTIGLFNLGFLVQLIISRPVIIGFTNAAALQVTASQLKGLFGLRGSSGNIFKESVYNFIVNVRTLQLWDTVMGVTTIVVLVGFNWFGTICNSGSKSIWKSLGWYFSLSRNAFVVFMGIIFAYLTKILLASEPFTLIGDIKNGLPEFKAPPLSTTIGNATLSFTDMVSILGPQSLILPIVAIFEIVAVSSAFSDGGSLDSSQEMIALGCCNIIGSFFRGIPVTASFSRAAVNYASGAKTPGGSIFTSALILLSLSLLTSVFYFIPKAVLSGIIIVAMYALANVKIMIVVWKNNILEFGVTTFTMVVCLFLGLEYGLMSGIVIHICLLMYHASKPNVIVTTIHEDKPETIMIQLTDSLFYCSVDRVRRKILRAARNVKLNSLFVIDGLNLRRMDFTVASNLIYVIKDLEKRQNEVILIRFNECFKKNLVAISPEIDSKIKDILNPGDLVHYKVKDSTSVNVSMEFNNE